jgi:hypothetical protein
VVVVLVVDVVVVTKDVVLVVVVDVVVVVVAGMNVNTRLLVVYAMLLFRRTLTCAVPAAYGGVVQVTADELRLTPCTTLLPNRQSIGPSAARLKPEIVMRAPPDVQPDVGERDVIQGSGWHVEPNKPVAHFEQSAPV